MGPEKKIGTVELDGEILNIVETFYADGKTTAILVEDEQGSPYATLSYNMGNDVPLAPGQIVVKAYAENAPVANAILATGLFKKQGSFPFNNVVMDVWAKVA